MAGGNFNHIADKWCEYLLTIEAHDTLTEMHSYVFELGHYDLSVAIGNLISDISQAEKIIDAAWGGQDSPLRRILRAVDMQPDMSESWFRNELEMWRKSRSAVTGSTLFRLRKNLDSGGIMDLMESNDLDDCTSACDQEGYTADDGYFIEIWQLNDRREFIMVGRVEMK